MIRCIIYIRVSTDEQAVSGLGLEAQLAACRAYALRMGWEVIFVFEDAASGGLPLDKRPVLLEALAQLGKDDVLLVAKRDRLSRGDIMATAMIEAAVKRVKARIVSAAGEGTESDDPSSILMRRMIDAFGEYERLIIKSRTRAALKAKAARGERIGPLPYGFRLTGQGSLGKRSGMPTGVEADPKEVFMLKLIARMRGEGATTRAIADYLNKCSIPTRWGGPWRHSTVAYILKRLNINGQT